MAMYESARKLWDRIHDGHWRTIEFLSRQYVEEMESMLRLQWHAEQVRYSKFSELLLNIAKEEQRHAQWLARRIRQLGGEVPKVQVEPAEELSSWNALSRDLDEEKRCCADLIAELALAKDLDPDTRQVLERVLQEEKKHLGTIRAMHMRTDPQAAARPL